MTNFEYAQIYIRSGTSTVYTPKDGAVDRAGVAIVLLMTELGADGWELVSSTADSGPGYDVGSHYFKRVRK